MIETLIHIDHTLFDFINQDLSNPFFDVVLPVVRNKKTWIPFYFLGAGLLFRYKRKQAIWIILFGVLSVGLADLVSSHFLKDYFARVRPCLLPDFANHVNLIVSRCSGAYSFPSSHAANHFALALFLSYVLSSSKTLIAILMVWAGIISFAQIYVGVHFPLDIIGGILVGVLSSLITYFLYQFVSKKMA